MGCNLSKHNRVEPERPSADQPTTPRPRKTLRTRIRTFFRSRRIAPADHVTSQPRDAACSQADASAQTQNTMAERPSTAFTFPAEADLTLPQVVQLQSRVLRSNKPPVDANCLRTFIEIQQESADTNRRLFLTNRVLHVRDMRAPK